MKEMFKIFLEDFIFYLVSKTRPYKICIHNIAVYV